MKELPLKNDIFCVYNGEESEVPLLFLCGKPTGNSKGLPLKEKERMIKRKARVIHEKIHEERAAGNGNLQLLRKETDCRQGHFAGGLYFCQSSMGLFFRKGRFTALTCAKAAMTRCGPSSPSMWKWRSRWSCCREDFGLKKGFIPGCGERLGDESFFHYLSYARLLGKEGGKTLWIAGTKEGTRLVNELAS